MKLPRFNLRELFWITLVVAMGLGWFGHWGMMVRQNLLMQQNLEREQAKVALLAIEFERHTTLRVEWRGPFLKLITYEERHRRLEPED